MVIAVSEPDRQALSALTGLEDIRLVPNGTDTSAYSEITPRPDNGDSVNIVFTGKMDYRPNIDAVLWFANEVWPVIVSQAPSATFQIVGQGEHERLEPLHSVAGIEMTGYVPEIEPYLAAASAFVIPMRIGGGTRLKALEAMSAGLPIVSTSLGVEGIAVQNGRELLIRDDPFDFANGVLELLKDRQQGGERCSELGRNAREFVIANYDWAGIVPLLEQAYRDLLAERMTMKVDDRQ